MKRVIKKKLLQVLFGVLFSIPVMVKAQPTPGDSGLGSLEGGVVGGGADLAINVWFVLALAIAYFLYKRKERIFNWYLNLDWGDYS